MKNLYKCYDISLFGRNAQRARMVAIYALILFLCGGGKLYAQSKITVNGIIVTSSGETITGANIVQVGSTTNGATSNLDGQFTISVPTGSTLSISYLGYTSQQVKATPKMNIILIEDSESLEEVVVVAYGVQTKMTVTGSISSVQTKDIKQSPAPNLIATLSGRLPGLTTVQGSGQPGEEAFRMFLRGASTTNGTQPLVLVDGVPRDNISSLDPNEIESVSVLKDASSTAVFGVRGANGVILVTTKQGTSEKPSLSVSAEFGRQDHTRDIERVDSWDHAIMRNQARANDGLGNDYSERQIQLFRDGTNALYPNTDWYRAVFKEFAPITRYNVNLSGGTDKIKYFVNAGLLNQGGMFQTESKSKLGYDPQFKLDRYNFRTNLDIKINSWIRTSVNLAAYIDQQNKGGGVNSEAANRGKTLNIIANIYRFSPAIPGPLTNSIAEAGYDVPTDELTSDSNGSWNPFGSVNRHGYIREDRSSLNSSVAVNFDLGAITKGLSSKAMVSFDTKSQSINDGVKVANLYKFSVLEKKDAEGNPIDEYISGTIFEPQFCPITVTKKTGFQYTLNMQWALNYARTFGGAHRVTAMTLVQRDNNERMSGASDLLLPYNVFGVSARATYGYDNRYLFEFNAGYNGSEQFAKGKRYGFFPAASVGWVVSNEAFMKKQKVITNLKFRVSYGKVGNDKLGDSRFLYLDNVVINDNPGFSGSLGGKEVIESLFANPDISWEIAYKQNYGIELSILKDITFSADFYKEKRDQILINRSKIPTMLGVPIANYPKANMGKVDNYGYELELGYSKTINKDWFISLRGNYNYTKNTVRELDELPMGNGFAYQYRRTGYSLSQDFGYQIDWDSPGKGFFTSQEEIDNYFPYDGTKPRAGDFVYKDLNGDKTIDIKDVAPLKYGDLPRITYSFAFNVSYKGFDISAMLQGVGQTSQYYSGWGVYESMSTDGVYFPHHQSAWTKDRYEKGQKIDYPALSTGNTSSMASNDFFVMDRSYVRLKNAEIGYTLPQTLTSKIGMSKVRFYINGQNLLVWDKIPFNHFDPEQTGATAVPIQRVINIGANIVF